MIDLSRPARFMSPMFLGERQDTSIDLLKPIASLEAEEGIGNEVIARLCTSTNSFPYALGSIWLRRQPSQRLE